MKQATCKDLKGACDTIITGNTPEEMAENAKKHAMEMFAINDPAHLEAMEEMKQMNPDAYKSWYEGFVQNFENLKDAEEK